MTTLLHPPAESHASIADNLPHVIVRVAHQHLAVPSACINQLLLMPDAIRIPHAPPEVRGMIHVRGTTFPLLDLRVMLGIPSFITETRDLVQLLHDREQDHRNWLTELQASIKQKCPFTLARNPHHCKFGKWYDLYKPQNVSVAFVSVWHSFDTPHCRIHAIADRVCDLAAQGDFTSAQTIIDATRDGELTEIIALFEQLRTLVQQTSREVAMILRLNHRQVALAVDEVAAIEPLDSSSIENLSDMNQCAHSSLAPRVAKRRAHDGQVVLMLDSQRLFELASSNIVNGN
jgi:chemotaxis signal transduction protein